MAKAAAKKVKWGITSEGVDSVEDKPRDWEPYDGEIPSKGIYRLRCRFMKQTVSSNDNPQVYMLWLVDDTGEKSKFNEAPIFERLTVTDNTQWKVKQFCKALGIKSSDFTDKTMLGHPDDDERITAFGSLKVDEDLYVLANVIQRPDTNGDGRHAEIAEFLPRDEEKMAEHAGDGGKKAGKGKGAKGGKGKGKSPF